MKFYYHRDEVTLYRLVDRMLDSGYGDIEHVLSEFKYNTVTTYTNLLQKLLDKNIIDKKEVYEILEASSTYDPDIE